MSVQSSEHLNARFAIARSVADAVVYEGYILYPYGAPSAKNQGSVRFQWGVLAPSRYVAIDPSERSRQRIELVVDPGDAPTIAVRVRCLQLQHRAVETADADGGGYTRTDRLDVGDDMWLDWDEAVEQDIDLGVLPLLPLAGAARDIPFQCAATETTEIITEGDGVVGRIVRTAQEIDGLVRVTTRWAEGPGALLKVTIEVLNTTDWCEEDAPRDEVMRRSLIAVHTLAVVEDGAFISLLDPAEGAEEAVAGCKSEGAFPVLVGRSGATDLVLASPIILYDYPAIAPESEGDFHDGCEIDEILALRVVTLTDEEKAEARATDPRARAIIDRCDSMEPDVWDRLHGIMRDVRTLDSYDGRMDDLTEQVEEQPPWMDPEVDASFDPWTDTVVILGVEIGKGSRVRMVPSHRADVHDMFLSGLTGTVAGVFHDVDGGFHVAVTVDGDPATELYEFQGRFYYFHPDELQPLTDEEADAIGQVETMAQAGRDVDLSIGREASS